jgi:inhibitor of cysteine peptidase
MIALNARSRRGSVKKGPAVFVAIVLMMTAAIGVGAEFPGHFPVQSTVQSTGSSNPTPTAAPSPLRSFQSVSQLQSYMAQNAASAQVYDRYGGSGFIGGPLMMVQGLAGGTVTMTATAMTTLESMSSTLGGAQSSLNAANAGVSSPSFTGTNVQVQGVDELDIVKTDGTYLYVATSGVSSSGSAVDIIRAYPPGNASVVSAVSFPGQVAGIEISPGRLMVVGQIVSNNTDYLSLLLYNTASVSSPKLMENVTVGGDYVGVRMSQGYLYAIIQQPSYVFNDRGNATGVMPYYFVNGQKIAIPPSSVYYTPNSSQIGEYTMIVSVSMNTGAQSDLAVLTGPSSSVYVSTSNIYVVYTNYRDFVETDGIPGDVWSQGVLSPSVQYDQNSTIFRASYVNGTVAVKAVGQVPGSVLNQFSMDEYNTYFRVATSRVVTISGSTTESDDVYVLNSNMTQVSALHNIAPGENLYAVRFDGSMGYVVTFEQVDPLFAISFADITHPVIVSALKVSGYSDYLQPLFNGQYLLGVGKNTVNSSTGDFTYYLGLKLSLFHVLPNGTSSDVQDYLIGDRGTDSPVLTNHLALTYDPANNITVIPVLLAQVPGNQQSTGVTQGPPPQGDPVWQGAYVFQVNSTGMYLLGRVTQYPAGQNFGSSPDSGLQIERSVIIGNYLYTISQQEVMVSSLSSLGTVTTVQLQGS